MGSLCFFSSVKPERTKYGIFAGPGLAIIGPDVTLEPHGGQLKAKPRDAQNDNPGKVAIADAVTGARERP